MLLHAKQTDLMEALIINTDDSLIDLIYLSICLRTAYLFMDRTGMAGDMKMNMYLNEDYHSIPLMMKYKLLKDYCEDLGIEENVDEIIKIEIGYLKHSKLKHQPMKGVTIFKQGESAINKQLIAFKNTLNEFAANCGLMELKELIETDVFNLYKLDKREEIPCISPNIFIKPSKVLQLQCSSDGIEDTLFTLTNALSDPDFLEDRIIYHINSKEALMENNMFLQKCFTFPSSIDFSISELKLLRDKLQNATLPFNETVNDWADMFTKSVDTSKRVIFFKENILPLLPAIQKTITENSIFNYASKKTKDVTVEVWLGEAPLSIVWEYYNYFRLISEASYDILYDLPENNPDYNRRVPVMVIATVDKGKDSISKFQDETDEEDEIVLIPRKSILINE